MMSDVDDDYVIVVAAADDAAASGFPLLLLLLSSRFLYSPRTVLKTVDRVRAMFVLGSLSLESLIMAQLTVH